MRNIIAQVPGTLAELPPRLRLPSIKARMTEIDSGLTLLKIWTGLETNILLQAPADQLAAITRLTDWFQLTPHDIPLIDFFDHNGERYFLPAAKFENGKAIEYPIADDYYNKFIETEEREHLVLLTATLCRPMNPKKEDIITQGDKRVPLNSIDEAKHRAKELEALPDEVLMAVKLYFEGIKIYISETYGHWLFRKSTDTEEEGGLNFGWWGAYQNAAEAGAFGYLQQVYQTRFHTVAVWMIRKKEAADRLEQQQNFDTAKSEANGE